MGPQRVAGEEAPEPRSGAAGQRGGVSGRPVGSRSGSVCVSAGLCCGDLGGSSGRLRPRKAWSSRLSSGESESDPQIHFSPPVFNLSGCRKETAAPGRVCAGLRSEICAFQTTELFWVWSHRRGGTGAGPGSTRTCSLIRPVWFQRLLLLLVSGW